MRKFLETFVHYCCSRCIHLVPGHRAQRKRPGNHAHNGEFLRMIHDIQPSSDGFLAAYHAWRDLPERGPDEYAGLKGECRALLAEHMRNPTNTQPRDAEERAVRILLDHWDNSYIRHGPEHLWATDYNTKTRFPTLISRHDIGVAVRAPNSEWFAVDLDAHPFRAFEEHPVENTQGPPWVYTVGLLPERIFQRFSGELYHPADRDHWYAAVNVPAKYWVFLYRDLDEHALHREEHEQNRHHLKTSGVPRIHYDDYLLLVQAYTHWRNYSRFHRYLKA